MKVIWYFLILSLPFTGYSVAPEMMKNGGQVSTFLVVLLWVACVYHSLYRGKFQFPMDQATKYFLLFFLVALLSVLSSAHLPFQEYGGERAWIKGLKQSAQLALSGSIYVLAPYVMRNRRDVMRSLQVYSVAYVFVLVYGLAELWNYYEGSRLLTDWLAAFHSFTSPFPTELPRLWLVAQEPSLAANYLLSVMPLLFLGVFGLRSVLLRWFLVFSCVFLFIFTFSLGGYLTLLAFVVVAILYSRRGVLKPLVYLGVCVVLLLAFSATRTFVAYTYERFTHRFEDPSVLMRLADAHTGLNTFLSSPVVGVGLGNALFYVQRDYPDWAFRNWDINWVLKASSKEAMQLTINNMGIRILAETGIIGGIFFFLWHLELFRTGSWSLQHSLTKQDRKLSLAILLAAIALTISYFTTAAFHLRYLFFMFGLIPAWRNILRTEQRAIRYAALSQSKVSAEGTVQGVPGLRAVWMRP